MHHVRLAVADDLPAILEISNWAALHTAANFAIEPETFESWAQSFLDTSERHPWLVANTGDTVVGFAKASPWKGRCAYHWSAETTVYVRSDQHRRGIGRALYTHLIDLLRRQGYRTLLGGITLPNDASVALHESCGFWHVATFERVGWKFDRWHDVGYWELLLGASDEAPRAIRPVREVAGARPGPRAQRA